MTPPPTTSPPTTTSASISPSTSPPTTTSTSPSISPSTRLTRPQASIDLDALAANYRALADRAGGTPPAGVVKADAYGLGVGPVARRLAAEGCTRFFVARLDEGLAVRSALADPGAGEGSVLPVEAQVQVQVLDGLVPGTEGEMIEAGLTPVLNDLGQIERWQAAASVAERPLPATLHFDTGMTRLGIPAEQADLLAGDPRRLDGLDIGVVMSHVASADVPGSDQPARQLERFLAVRSRFGQGVASLANSAATFLGPEYHFDLIRPGIALYGGAPLPGCGPSPMETVVTVTVPVIQIQDVGAGTEVGYGATHVTPKATRLATIPVGYADGYPRAAGRERTVAIGDHLAPAVGRVSMDLVVVDVGDLPDGLVRPGTEVELLGPRRPVDDVAAEAGTIANEILTGLSHRYQRIYRGDPADPVAAAADRTG